MATLPAPLILASTSPYRAALLRRLGLAFQQEAPGIDEVSLPGEDAPALVRRLAISKARAVAQRHPEAIVIGSDQMALAGKHVLGKPGSLNGAMAQLRQLSGQSVRFLTGLAVLCPGQPRILDDVLTFDVLFRNLSEAEISDYVAREKPIDTAGSFKSEGLGIALFEKMQGDDPSTLIGLPLIRLTDMLKQCGCRVLG